MSEDEKRRKQEKPSLSVEKAAEIIKEIFGVHVDVQGSKAFDSYDDANFYVKEEKKDKGGREFVCKFHNGVESGNKDYIESQNAMMIHLAKDGFIVPYPQKSEQDQLYGMTILGTAKKPVKHAVRLLSFVDGCLLCDSKINPTILKKAGEYLGNLESSLDKFKDGKGLIRTHLWDLKNFEQVLSPQFVAPLKQEKDGKKLKLLMKSIELFRARVLPKAEKKLLRMGLVHGDFNDANIVLDQKQEQVYGVIDFGDSTHTWKVNDPSIAIAYIAVTLVKADSKDIVGFGTDMYKNIYSAMLCFMRGFHAKYQLQTDEMSVLLTLAACRIATSATMGWYSFSLDPTNAYLKYHAEPGWKALEIVLNIIDTDQEKFLEDLNITSKTPE